MISIYKNETDKGIQPVAAFERGVWVNAIDPSAAEVEQLIAWGAPADFVHYPLDMDERPHSEREDDGSLLVLMRVPLFQGHESDVPYVTVPLGIIVAGDAVFTVCRQDNDVLNEMLAGRNRGQHTAKRYRFILHVLFITAVRFLNHLRQINRIVEEAEDRMERSQRNRELLTLLKYQKSLVYFTTALKSNDLMLERLQRWHIFRQFPADEDLLEDTITEYKQAIEMVTVSTSLLNSTMAAFSSVISNNLNTVMKFLTAATVVISLPTMVYSFFGMNVPIPWQHSAAMFIAILIASSLISVLVIFWFSRRNLF